MSRLPSSPDPGRWVRGDVLRGGPPPLEVLHVVTRYAQGGSERRLIDAVGAVDAHHVVVVGGESDPEAVRELESRVQVVRCASLVRSLDPVRDLRALAWLTSFVRSRPVDVVHTHQSKAGLLGRLAARAQRGAVVIHSASMANFGPGYGRIESTAFALAERITAPLVERFVVVGGDLAGRIAANGVPASRLTTIRSSLELTPFAPPSPAERIELRRRFGLDREAPVVAFVGSLDARKGVDRLPVLLRAALGDGDQALGPDRGPRRAPDRSIVTGSDDPAPRACLLVAGEGPLGPSMAEELASVPGLEVVMLGHVDDVASVMRASDLLVLPSSAEGLPQVVVQAAAADLPVVAYDVDGIREMAHLGATVAIVPFGDEASFGDAVRTVVHRRVRGARRRGLLASGVLDEWQPARVADRYRSVYASLPVRRVGR